MSKSPATSSTTTSFIDPASLSFPSPPPDEMSSVSSGPSRKRPRSEISSEERKEARAHRNRIAAQNSRDRRKAQFSYLERRVAELEEENRQLRAGMGLSTSSSANPALVASAPATRSRADEARDRENEELRERIRTLEKGWDAVVKALAAQGLPTGIPPSDTSNSSSVSQTTSTQHPTSSAPSADSSSIPISPAPSNSSLDFPPSTAFSIHSPPSTGGDHARNPPSHVPAAGELVLFDPYGDSQLNSHHRTDGSAQAESDAAPDDATMETLFREIITERESSPAPQASSELPSLPATSLPTLGIYQSQVSHSQAAVAHTAASSEEEMKRLTTTGGVRADRGMSVSSVSLGGSTGLSTAIVGGNIGGSDAEGLGLGLGYNHHEMDMMDMGEYIGDSTTASPDSNGWSDIGFTLEGLLDILPPATQDATQGPRRAGSSSDLWESFEGRLTYV